MPHRPQTPDDVESLVQDRGIRFIRLWFTDILGQLKSFAIHADQLDDAFEGGMGFDGSSITGFNAIEESDMIAMPDASTFAVLPWRPEDEAGVARMFADIRTPEGEPYEGDPRHILRRAEDRMREMGFDAFNVGPELKYGWHATFMPKPLFGENGSGMHTHQSLFTGGANAFYDADDKYFLSDVGKAFIAGQLRHAREICAIFAQWVNSYKRLVPGYEAPVYVAWSRRNRSA